VAVSDVRTSRRSGPRLALLALAQFVIAVDYNNVYVALPDIGAGLGFSAQSLQWVVSAYAVAFGGLLLLGGRAADRLGARRMFVLALLIYGLSSLVGGLATHQHVLVAARAVQGIGGALLLPAVLALINTRFPEGRERNRALAVWGSTGSGGLAAGALLGGVITNAWGWPWVLLIVVPMALGAAAAAPILIAKDPAGRRGGGFDLLGALVATAGVSLVVFGLVSGPEAGWMSVRGLGALAVGTLLVLAFYVIERTVKDPLVTPALFRNRRLLTAMAVAFLHHCALSSGYYLFTVYLQNVLGYTALQAGLAFLPLGVLAMLAGGKVAVVVLNRHGVRAALATGMFVYLLSAQAARSAPQTLTLKTIEVDVSMLPASGQSHAPVSIHRHFANPALLRHLKAEMGAAAKSRPRRRRPTPTPTNADGPARRLDQTGEISLPPNRQRTNAATKP